MNAAPRHRIVSLIASATEIVCALGCEDQLVGRSHECDYPPGVVDLPACSAPKFDVEGTSRQIDDRVKTVLQEATSVYSVDAERLDRLEPTVIITQTQCEVCAVSLKDVEAAACELIRSQPRIVALSPNSLHDVWNDIRRVAEALGVPERGEELIERCEARLANVASRTLNSQADFPLVACIEWIDPLMAAGNWVPELVELAGGENAFGEAGHHSPWLSWDDLLNADPDVIVFMPCGFDLARTRQELQTLTARPEWRELIAVASEQVYLADGNQYFNRPGPRLAESAEILAEILHPELVQFGHEGTGWVRLIHEPS